MKTEEKWLEVSEAVTPLTRDEAGMLKGGFVSIAPMNAAGTVTNKGCRNGNCDPDKNSNSCRNTNCSVCKCDANSGCEPPANGSSCGVLPNSCTVILPPNRVCW